MKTLLLVRHAKSEHHFAAASDFERSLNEKGLRDAADMAARLVKRNIRIDLFVSSPARRALTTAQSFMAAYGIPEDRLLLIPELYHAAPPVFLDVLSQLSDNHESVALFAHNPGITDFAAGLTSAQIDNMPTAAVFGAGAETDRWRDFAAAPKRFLFFDYPKA